MRSRLAFAFLLVGILAICGTAFAHHGNVAYQDKPIDLKSGTVTKFIWTNPHSFIMFDVTNDKGEVGALGRGSGQPLSPDAARLDEELGQARRHHRGDGVPGAEWQHGRPSCQDRVP